ncbi:MAG TPA: hypothetical protein VMW13_04415 [Dehalococcoidales bacterium]|nr:hypothetical protein [Dehalococcoidales bacterium]
MLAADALAAAWIVWTTALAADTRLNPNDQATLTAYETKLETLDTSEKEDLEVLRIHREWMQNRVRRAGP